MLSRKGSSAGMMAVAPAAVDRTRVGERLHAALAGLQELHLLRDRQSEMVSWALRADREEPVTSVHHSPEDLRLMGAEEQRLEATLTALKQQLSRLRKQDVGLKSHLQQLDQQINELKLDVNKASTDQQETDSRPSSGFYELSDGGSGSLSNSCTSVYSACMSSPQATLPTSPPSSHVEPPQNQTDVSRRRSADESTAQHSAPRVKGGLHLGSSRIRANTEKTRPRPVSTGDLDRMMGQMQNYNKPVDTSKPIASPVSPIDSKFHSNLVSRTGVEMYQYPSPLHAVALQSPIFSPNNETTNHGLLEKSNSLQRSSNCDTKTMGVIDKILQRSFSKLSFESGTDTLSSQHSHRKPSEVVTVFPDVIQKEVSALPPLPPPPPPALTAPQTTNVVPAQDNDQKRHYHPAQEAADNTNQYKQLLRTHEVSHRLSFPADTREYSSDEVTTSTLKKAGKIPVQYSSLSRSHSDYRSSDNTEPRHDRKSHKQRLVVSQSSSTEEGHSFEAPHSTSPQFVHAQFVPAGSQRVKVRQADRKSKNVKLKKKNVEKPRKQQQHGYSSGEKSKDSSSGKSEHKKSSKVKVLQKSPVYLSDEHRRGSGSDSSHCSPGFMYTQKIQAKPQANAAVSKLSKNHRKPQNMEYEVDQRKKRQGDRPADVYQNQMSYRQRSREVPNMHMVRSASFRSGQWMQQPQRHFPTSISANAFHQNLNARYPAAPYHMTSRYPPRCESEYSAECASLFHSTIAASSDGEMSDHTTNRFGDSESSQSYQSFSDSDSSLSFDEEEDFLEDDGGMVWANAAMGPMTTGRPIQPQQQQPPKSAPSACRIKASRALKKKIRRFQPASLKVMTLV